MCVYRYLYMHVYVCVYRYMFMHVYVYLHVYIHIYTYIYIERKAEWQRERWENDREREKSNDKASGVKY